MVWVENKKSMMNAFFVLFEAYTYDDYSNRTAMTVREAVSYSTAYVYDANNRLSTETKITGNKTEATSKYPRYKGKDYYDDLRITNPDFDNQVKNDLMYIYNKFEDKIPRLVKDFINNLNGRK